MKKIYYTNTNQRKARVAKLISDREDLIAKKVIRVEEGHYIMIKMSILQEDITILNVDTLRGEMKKTASIYQWAPWQMIQLMRD